MFSGLVEQTSSALDVEEKNGLLRLTLGRPPAFHSLKEGESVCVDGVCLTLETFDREKMIFILGPETLKITGWTSEKLKNKLFNLEKAILLQDAVGGHLLTGHVDGLASLEEVTKQGDSVTAQVKIPKGFKNFFWKKGFIALNGVSLTVNKAKNRILEIGLIPKTLKLTNLSHIKKGDLLNFEVDYMSRCFVQGSAHIRKMTLFLYLALFFVSLALFFCVVPLFVILSTAFTQ